MPFTFSHPAIVLPITFLPQKWFSLTGLVIGSLTPDFEYFLRMKILSNYSHTINGVFWFDLPLGILLAFIFHNIVRDCLFDNLPAMLSSRLTKFKQFDWNTYFKKNWLVVLISIIIGAFSHLFWDAFTHEHGYFVQSIPALTNSIHLLGFTFPTFKIIQHLSTLIGGVIIAFAFFQLIPEENFISKVNKNYWIVFAALIFTIIVVRIFSGLNIKLFGELIVTIISAGLISLILTPMILRQKY